MLTALLLLCVFACFAMVLFLGRRGWFQPAIMFLLSAILDVFFPAIYWLHLGQVNNPDWLPLLNFSQINDAVIFYIPFFALFMAALLVSDRQKPIRYEISTDLKALERRVLMVAALVLALTFLKMALEIISRGGLEAWFWSRFIFSTIGDGGAEHGLLAILPVRDMFQALAGLGFFYRNKFQRRWLFGVLFPTLAVLLAMLTFLRGSVLTCTITLIFAEVMRRKMEGSFHGVPHSRTVKSRQTATVLACIAIMAFGIYGYGSVRDGFRGAVSGGVEEGDAVAAPTFLTAGHGLLGLAHILSNYGAGTDWLYGKTYIDMALLPVPRAIYPSKPDWYGIDDITRGMGWPETTQSAVTMPGEAYANFGIWGLFMAIPLGLLFGALNRVVTATQVGTLLLGPTMFFQIPAVANWMAFTGIMNSLPLVALVLMVVLYINGSHRRVDSAWAGESLSVKG